MSSYNSTIKPKLKPCKDCKKDSYIFSKGRCMICYRKDYALNKQKQPSKELSNKKPYVISKVSKKMASELVKYRKVRDKYMKSKMICEFKGCGNQSADLHHVAGRGINLCNVDLFMSLCRNCHNWIHENDKEARELGYLKNKL